MSEDFLVCNPSVKTVFYFWQRYHPLSEKAIFPLYNMSQKEWFFCITNEIKNWKTNKLDKPLPILKMFFL